MTEEIIQEAKEEEKEDIIEEGIHVCILHKKNEEEDSQIKVGLTPTSLTLNQCVFALLRQIEKLHPDLYFKIERYLLNKAILRSEEIRNEVANDLIKQKDFVKSLLETHKQDYLNDDIYEEMLDKLNLINKKDE